MRGFARTLGSHSNHRQSMADKKKNPTIRRDEQTLVRERLKRPRKHKVVLHNDDYTPMEFVVEILQLFFGMSRDKATQVMLTVHTSGKATCGIFPRDIAETKSAQVNQCAKDNEHPLVSEIEPVADDE